MTGVGVGRCGLLMSRALRLTAGRSITGACATTFRQRLIGDNPSAPSGSQRRRNYGSIFEPEYLKTTGPEIPVCDMLTITIKGYDFPVLEKYHKYVHITAERIGLGVEDAWAVPAKKLRVTKLKPESNVIESEYNLNLYERDIQISEVPATILPLFINIVESALPAGVTLRVKPFLQEDVENRFVPDLQLKDLKTQLESMKTDRDREKETTKK